MMRTTAGRAWSMPSKAPPEEVEESPPPNGMRHPLIISAVAVIPAPSVMRLRLRDGVYVRIPTFYA